MRRLTPASHAPRMLTAGALLLAILGACSAASPAPSGSPEAPSTGASTPSIASAEPTRSPTATADATPAPAADPGGIGLELVADGLVTPIGIVGSEADRLYVVEQGGRIVAVEADGSLREVADLSDRMTTGGERGLLGLALHPGWPEVRRAFVHYTDLDGNTVLSELAATSGAAPTIDPGSERVMLRAQQPAANHNGGQLAFGPDGYLYMALGDGGGGGDPFGNGQNRATLLGAILRIAVDGGDPYAIPPDNPFVGGEDAPEVYVYGLRNPWRFSFDRATGDLWIGDVGQNAWEEVDRLDAGAIGGANLGWNVTEGAHCFADAGCDPAAFTLPVAEYPTADGCAVIGGHVYRGSSIPALSGWYLFADYCSGQIYAVRSDAPPSVDAASAVRPLLASGLRIASFGQSADGELFVADAGSGAIYRVVASE